MKRYEVFISFRNSDEYGRRTRDADMAEDLYHALQKAGIRAFYSNKSIQDAAESDYIDAIDEALECCNILVAVGTSRENLTSRWVKQEIKQFRADMYNGVKEMGKCALISYCSADFDPRKLPSGLRECQSFTDLDKLVAFIQKFRKKGSGFKEVEAPPKDEPYKMLQPGSLLDGRYKILNQVGRGGMSEVYCAIDEKSNRTYAVKVIRRDGIKDFKLIKSSLISECEMMSRLDHPSIPKIREVIDIPDHLAIVMDFIEGHSLLQILIKNGSLDQASLLKIAKKLGETLHYLHHRPWPIIHRDIKPANIILQPDGNIKLLDFGTARYYKEGATGDTTCLGTVGYASPEQFGGMGQTDVRSDIYNLGATLYHLITGNNPCEPPYEIRPIRECNPDLSYGLEYIIQKCVQRDPNNRFQTAKDFLDALDHIDQISKREKRKAILKEWTAPYIWREKKRKNPPKPPAPVSKPAFAVPGFPPPVPASPPPVPVPGSTPFASRPEPLFETTVLGPVPPPAPVVPKVNSAGFPLPPPVQPPQPPASSNETAALSPQILEEVAEEVTRLAAPPEAKKPPVFEEEAPPVKAKRAVQPRKVTTKKVTAVNTELEDTIAKLSALDPESQRIVRDLINQLSK